MGHTTTKNNGRIVMISFVPRTLLYIFVFFQVLVKRWYYDGVRNDGIPKAYAFSQSTRIETKHSSFSRRESDSFDVWRKKISIVTPTERKTLVVLHDTQTSTATINSTESNFNTAASTRGNTRVRRIMAILEDRYELPLLSGETVDQKSKTREWKKTRNYLYHATRSHHDRSGSELDDIAITFEEQVVTVLDFLDERLELSPYICKRILQESPRILRKPVDSFLIPTSDFLLQLWGRELFLQAVERNPSLLLSSGVGYTTNRKSKGRSSRAISATYRKKNDTNGTTIYTNVDQTVEQILYAQTGFSHKTMKRIKGTSPFIFGLEPSKVDSVLDFLDGILRQSEGDTNTNSTDTDTVEEVERERKKILGKMILAYPHLLNLSVESNLEPRVKFLAESCDLNPMQLAKVVQTSNGSVLGLSVEQNLKPTMDFLLEELFFYDSENGHTDDPRTMLKKCVLTHPQLLGLSLSNLKSKANYFHSIGPSLAVRIARKCPAIYSLNLNKNIIPTIEFLARLWGFNSETISSKKKNVKDIFVPMLHEYPNIVTLSVETNLQPTMMFFNKTGYTLLNEKWELVPPTSLFTSGKRITPSRIRGRYIAASLYNRLLPRWHYCLSSNADAWNPDGSTESPLLALSSPPPLHLLVMASDEAFCETMDFQLESFLNYKKEAIPRLKFSSQFDTWLKTGKPIDL